MEEKEKLEKGEVTPSEGERTVKTATTEEMQAEEIEEVEELTTENCEVKLKELKANLEQSAPLPLPRDTSFDRLSFLVTLTDSEWLWQGGGF